jgi:glutamate-1-semialdehyde 2,1-aminomutase
LFAEFYVDVSALYELCAAVAAKGSGMSSIKQSSAELFARARECIPGGVNSPVRAWSAVGGRPRFVASASGARITDVEGRSYLDFMASWGPLILGHTHPAVMRSVEDALVAGTSFGAPTAREVAFAEELCAAVSSLERVRLVSSGTEATMSALRLARAATGRPEIVKFAGCYHGHVDGLLVRAGSGATTLGVPDSPGVPEAIASLTRIATYNDPESVRAQCGDRTAAVIVEPVAGNMGVVPPAPGFLEALRETCDATGALLVFDEVITGFRLTYGGYQNLCGVTPDLTCMGKIVGGGLPVGAYGGRADLMDQIAPAGPVYQAGTLSGNPLAVSAGLATLAELRADGFYERLDSMSVRLQSGIAAALGDRAACIQRVGSMMTLFFGVDRVRCYEEATGSDTERFGRFFAALLDEGIWFPPSQFEAWFVSAAHTEQDVDDAIAAIGRAIIASD